MLSSFHLNGHTLGFHPQTQKGTNLSAFIHIQTDNSITNLKLGLQVHGQISAKKSSLTVTFSDGRKWCSFFFLQPDLL